MRHKGAELQFAEAEALWALRRREEALAQAEAALAYFTEQGVTSERTIIAKWLADRQTGDQGSSASSAQ